MLDITENKLLKKIDIAKYDSNNQLRNKVTKKAILYFLMVLLFLTFIILFLPWTQNVNGDGCVTALRPDQRPQTIQNTIPGKIEEWFATEGEFV